MGISGVPDRRQKKSNLTKRQSHPDILVGGGSK
jgi:hypothetical protein